MTVVSTLYLYCRGVKYEHRISCPTTLSSKLLGTVTGWIPTIDTSHQNVSLGEEFTNLQQHCSRLLTLSVPGSVVHQQRVLKLPGILEGLEHIALIIILDIATNYEGSGSWSSSDLGLVGVGDHPQDRGENEDDEHDVTEEVPAQLAQLHQGGPPADTHCCTGICNDGY